MESVSPQPVMEASGRRKSVFAEVGLVDEATIRTQRSPAPTSLSNPKRRLFRPSRIVRFRSRNEVFEESDEDAQSGSDSTDYSTDSDMSSATQPRSNAGPTMFYRAGLLALVLAIMLPILQINPTSLIGVKGGAIPRRSIDSVVVKREDTDTNICKRWAHQCKYSFPSFYRERRLTSAATIVNGTVYIYGGRSTTDPRQTSDTWSRSCTTPHMIHANGL